MPADLPATISRRIQDAGLTVETGLVTRLAAYLELLSRWNRRINLTALDLDPPSDIAIDRLLVEPLAAARRVGATDRLAIDVGSGGGSPAIPLKIAVPHLRMVLVESKVRKSAFLREVVRELALHDVEVENRRLEHLGERSDLQFAADLVTLRAVRADRDLWSAVRSLLRPGGRILWFGGRQSLTTEVSLAPLGVIDIETLVTTRDRQALIVTTR